MTNYPIAQLALGATAAYAAASATAALIARAGFPIPPADRRIGCIDGLRGYLALSVLAHHFIIWMQVTRLHGGWAAPSVPFFNQLGAGGVALFFMTTGLVFYPRVLAGFRSASWPAIYTARVFRIVPMIAVSVAIISAIIAWRTGHGFDRNYPAAAAQWLAAWNMPPLLGYPDSGRLNAYVLWSLWYEWLFYLFLLPTCALVMDLIRNYLPSWTLPVALLLGSLVAHTLHPSFGALTFLPLFATGMLAHECQRRGLIARILCTPAATATAIAALALVMLTIPTPYAAALPAFAFFFTCIACGNSMFGLLRTTAALVLGECSYSIYLLHGILLSVLFVDLAPLTQTLPTTRLPILLPLAATLVVLATSVTHLLIEKPAIALGKRLIRGFSFIRRQS